MRRVRTALVVLGLINPAYDAIYVTQDRRWNRLPGNAGRPRIDCLVLQPIEIGDYELSIGEHLGLELVLLTPCPDLFGGVGAERHDLDLASVQLGPEFLPSPQLGDTIGSPMAAKEFHQDGTTGDTGNRELVTVLIERGEMSQGLADSDRVVRDPLWADVNEGSEEKARRRRDGGGNAADPSGILDQHNDPETRTPDPTRDEKPAISRDLDALDSLDPDGH